MQADADDDDKSMFLAKWFDRQAQLVKEFFLVYFCRDRSVEMYDRKARRVFLRRTACDTVQKADLYVGSAINVFGRKLRLTECLNSEMTNLRLDRNSERTLVLLRGDAKRTLSFVLYAAFEQGLRVVRLIETCLTKNGVAFLRTCCHREWQPLAKASSRAVLLIELLGSESVQKTTDILERQATTNAEEVTNQTILYQSTSAISNLSWEESKMLGCQADAFEDDRLMTDECTCCLVKPHAIKEGLAGKILVDIANSGLDIGFIQLVDLETWQSELFLEVYKGVVSEYQEMVSQLASGPVLALAIIRTSSAKTSTFRELVGPTDPEIARQIRPTTLRAKYGTDRVKNAVHCTDLVDDAQLEVNFFMNKEFQRTQRVI